MNAVDRYLLKNGYNLDGSKMSKKQKKKGLNSNQKRTEILIATKKTIHFVKMKYEN